MSNKSSTRGPTSMSRGGNDEQDLQKPLGATLLQELQNIREKLKNEDDSEMKGSGVLHDIILQLCYSQFGCVL